VAVPESRDDEECYCCLVRNMVWITVVDMFRVGFKLSFFCLVESWCSHIHLESCSSLDSHE
jgi:hypothetical protein